MLNNSFLLSFRNTIISLVILSAVIPVSIISTGLIGKIHTITRETAIKEMDIIAESISEDLKHQIELCISSMKGIASSRDIALATKNNPPGLEYYFSERTPVYLKKIIEVYPIISDIYLTDNTGHVAVSVSKQGKETVPAHEVIQQVKMLVESAPDTPEKFISMIIDENSHRKNPEGQNSCIVIIMPVIIDIIPTIQGALIAKIPISNLKMLADLKANESANIKIKPFASSKNNNQKSENFETIERNSTLTVPNPGGSEDLKYTVTIVEASSKRFRYVDRALIDLILFQIAIILSILLVVYVVARRMTMSLQTINTIVNRYASGNYSYTGNPVLFSELQSIIDVLKKMGHRITEQISSLKQAEQKYRSIFENINEGIFQAAPNGKFISANPAMVSLLGFSSENEILNTVFNIVTDLFLEKTAQKKIFKLIENNDRISGFEARIQKKNKEIIWVSMSVRIVKDENAALVYYEGSIMDITINKTAEAEILKLNAELEKRVLERTTELEKTNRALVESFRQLHRTTEQLVQSEKMASLGNLVAGVSHEINTPVGIGVTATSFLEKQTEEIILRSKDSKMTKSEFEKYLCTVKESSEMILVNLNRAADLINSFKKIAVDQTIEDKRFFNLKSYIDEIILSLKPKLKRTKHQLEIKCPANIELKSFPGAFSQIITNLVMNSLLHAFADNVNGKITIEIIPKNNFIEMIYTDNGKGMKPETVKMIFEPFFTTNRSEGGTGLGLHITYNIVTQQLKGKIFCTSSLGAGTKFTIKIPIANNALYRK